MEKCSRTLYLYEGGEPQAAFPVSLGLDPLSTKSRRGDGATPEGLYRVTEKHRSRRYDLFVGLSYPSLKDVMLARWEGRLGERELALCLRRDARCPLGYGVGIHGGGVVRDGERDWTHGCVALDDGDMRRVFRFAEPGVPVLIYDATKPLFETLRHLVVAPEPVRPGEPWVGRWAFDLPGLELRVTLREDARGRRRLGLFGYDPRGELLFWLEDRNGNGVLEGWETRRCYRECQSYRALRLMILEGLPLWAGGQAPGRGG